MIKLPSEEFKTKIINHIIFKRKSISDVIEEYNAEILRLNTPQKLNNPWKSIKKDGWPTLNEGIIDDIIFIDDQYDYFQWNDVDKEILYNASIDNHSFIAWCSLFELIDKEMIKNAR